MGLLIIKYEAKIFESSFMRDSIKISASNIINYMDNSYILCMHPFIHLYHMIYDPFIHIYMYVHVMYTYTHLCKYIIMHLYKLINLSFQRTCTVISVSIGLSEC